MNDTKDYTAKIHSHEDGVLHIEVSIPWENVEKYRGAVLKKYSASIKVDGFRQGHVPENVVLQHVGASEILEDMAELAIKEMYPKVIIDNALEVIGHPHISITKIAEKNPLEFKAHVSELPKVELPDYKTLAKEVNKEQEETVVEDKEVEDAINHIRREWAKKEKLEAKAVIEGKNVSEIETVNIEVKDEELPEMNDEFAKKIGNFTDVKDFEAKLRENIFNEKKMRATDKQRGAILEKIRANTKLIVPEVLIEAEVNRMMAQFQGDVERIGMKFKDYIKNSGKKIEDLRSAWKPDAEKYAKNQMILNKIAIEEKIEPDKKLREEQIEGILKTYKDAERERVEIYVDTIITNDMVLEFLEGQK